MKDRWIVTGALLAAVGVTAGAFGAHGLKDLPAKDLAIFETGVRYHMLHAMGMILVGLAARVLPDGKKEINRAGWVMCFGLMVFSGTLYGIVLTQQRWLGAVTPLGGLALILSWLLLAQGVVKKPGAK